MKPIRVLLVEDHALVRAGFRALLQGLREIEIVAEAGNGKDALRSVEAHQPDVILLDIAIPEPNGLEVAAYVAKKFPNVRVIILSMHANEEYVLQALRAGAVGYLLKDADACELELAVKAVVRGETYLSSPVSKLVIEDYVRRVEREPRSIDRLTLRQREVLRLIANGHTTKRIAQELNISIKTAETHRAQVMKELGVHDVAGLVRYAIHVGLVIPDD
jgi:DNA-binding NarL/FixJ family response regulator